MLTSRDDSTRKLFPDFFQFGKFLNPGNRWLRLSELIPWEKLDGLYCPYFSENKGRPARDSRLICGLLIVKYITRLSDEEVVKVFSENPYVQAFCGRKHFDQNSGINPGILSERRKRLGKEFFDFFNSEIVSILREQKYIRYRTNFETDVPKNLFQQVASKIKNMFK